MYAIVDIGGMQWKVSQKTKLRVPKIELDPGKSVEFDRVLLVVDKETVEIGKPVVPNAKIKATVISHGKDKKVNVFKKKRRKNYRVLRGHRQDYTEITIDQISVGKAVTTNKQAAEKPKAETEKQKTEKHKPAAAKPKIDKPVAKKTGTQKTGAPKTKTAAKKSTTPKKEKKD